MATVFSTLHTTSSNRNSPKLARSGHALGIVGAVLFHLILIIALLQYAPARRSLAKVAPVIVSLITEPNPQVTPPPPKPPALPKVRTQQLPPPVQKVVEPPPIVSTAPTESPITIAPAPAVVPTPSAVFVPETPPPIIPPRFNADYLQNPPPPYPALARRMREQGRVLVRVLVSTDGLAERIELKTSSGSTRLDQSALDTIKSWKFVPAHQGDQKVAAWVIVPIIFTLEA